MIDIRKLKELVRLMVNNDLMELDLRDETEQVTIRRPSVHAPPQVTASMPASATPAVATPAAPSPPAASAPAEETDDRLAVESPMVGTFYAAPSPDKPPFVKIGDSVGPDTVVCLIEAMKVFNEIKAECSGIVDEVLVANGTPVEFGQPLLRVRSR